MRRVLGLGEEVEYIYELCAPTHPQQNEIPSTTASPVSPHPAFTAARSPLISSSHADHRRRARVPRIYTNVKNIHETFKSCAACPPDIDFSVHLCAHRHRVTG